MRRKGRLGNYAVALVAGIVAACLSLAGLLEPADEAVYDRLSTRMPAGGGMPPVIVVAIDEPSFAEIGQPWPWPRTLHADLVDSIKAGGAKAIGIDVVFADPSQPQADAALANALGPETVLAADLVRIDTPQGALAEAVDPLQMLVAGGARAGQIGMPIDADGAIRRLSPDLAAFASVLAGRTAPEGARIRFSPQGISRVSYYQALHAATDLPPDIFRDKVVLVGLTLRASPLTAADAFRTPATASGAGLSPGVEVQAQAYRSLASASWFRPAPAWLPALLALAIAFAAAPLGRSRPAWLTGVSTLGLALLAPSAATLLLLAGIWLPPAAPALAAVVAGVGRAGLDLARERHARREITRIFGHYMAPSLVRKLAENPAAVKLGGERRFITAMFCDLRGFTTLSERFRDDPEGLTSILNQALGVIADAVLENEGLIDKFIGDCVMGIWNAPADDPDHADHAIAAGRAAIAGIAELSRRLGEEGHAVKLACGVGINSGECTVGNLGTARRFDYTALGDPVNVASRLESMTKEFGVPILIGESTAALVKVQPLVGLDEARVRGREAGLRVYTVAGI
jgi:adenylate cyclase